MTRSVIVALLALLAGCTTTVPESDSNETGTASDSNEPEAECTDGYTESCVGSEPGISERFCWGGKWTECCTYPTFEDVCDCDPDPTCWTPLVLVFGGDPIQYTSEVRGAFDLTGRGLCVGSDWPTASTPWLTRDLNHNGAIDDGGELFGSATRLRNGNLAPQGFAALSELDDNLDGLLTPQDLSWASLGAWADGNADRYSQSSELASLNSYRVRWIALDYRVQHVCDSRGNCGVERARFGYIDEEGQDRVGEVVDVHLRLH
ncbi:MAG: calcium-binding protein [Polyangiaceae bacterium]|nr:calcium-binding protein [Polyangiaceae bacterium]